MARAEFKLVRATSELVNALKGNLRERDRREVYLASHSSADESLQAGFESSKLCWVGLLNGEPVLCVGAAPCSVLGGIGIPWMLATDNIDNVRRRDVAFILDDCLPKMFEGFYYLENWVWAEHKKAVRWLKWGGFNIEEPQPYGAEGEPFHRFWLKGDDYVRSRSRRRWRGHDGL